MSDKQCFICGIANETVLQEHHIVPKRHGGSDDDENLVDLCASCHQAVEKIYDKRFYKKLGVANHGETYTAEELEEQFQNYANTVYNEYNERIDTDVRPFPETTDGEWLTDEAIENLGIGEYAGSLIGEYHAMKIAKGKFGPSREDGESEEAQTTEPDA